MENKLVRLNPQIIVINICFCIILVVLIGCYQNLAPVEIGKGSIYSSKTKVPKPTKKPSITQMHERNVADTQNILKFKNVLKSIKKRASNNRNIVKVNKGDTVYKIARRYQVSVRSIIKENSLKTPFKLYVGQLLKLPNEKFHIVKEGDTLYSLTRSYEINLNALVRMNNIPPPYQLHVGDRLRIPTVLARISRSHQIKQSKVVQTQRKPEKSVIKVVPTRTGRTFLWAARGPIISDFGSKAGGLHNDGINLALATGTPVRASENGLVVYSGNELPGYGNLLLIRHTGGWISAYAHNQSLTVERGDLVSRGDIVAYAGSTGNVSSPQLHFELRLNGKPVNPITYLAQQE